ncbi:Ribonuclease H-like domain [Phytophthora cactorum]|nr:Ribonuclease H-like domain [Phytophthora cactorum]
MCAEVLRVISGYLPAEFGIVFDGWTFKSEHYVAVFAAFGHGGKQKIVLLAMVPLLDKEHDPHHDADAHIAFLKTILKPMKRHIECVRFLVGDNCSVKSSISTKLGTPLVGCASHRLNLSVNQYLETYAGILHKR